jgi:hypothetical protein
LLSWAPQKQSPSLDLFHMRTKTDPVWEASCSVWITRRWTRFKNLQVINSSALFGNVHVASCEGLKQPRCIQVWVTVITYTGLLQVSGPKSLSCLPIIARNVDSVFLCRLTDPLSAKKAAKHKGALLESCADKCTTRGTIQEECGVQLRH